MIGDCGEGVEETVWFAPGESSLVFGGSAAGSDLFS